MSKLLIILCGVMICTIFVPHDAFAKSFTIKLSESMILDSGDTKPGDKKKDTKNKKTDTKKEPKKKEPKKKEIKKPKVKKTKHDTTKNSISNIR